MPLKESRAFAKHGKRRTDKNKYSCRIVVENIARLDKVGREKYPEFSYFIVFFQ